jgi:DNA-binding IclR family transcriptional regulator
VQIPNVDRSLQILETLAGAPDGLSLGALAQQLELPKSAAHRLLQALAGRGYVHQDPVSQSYAMSLKLAVLGFRFLHARHLSDVVQGALDRLARQSGEYCRIAVLEGENLVWIARAQGATQGLRYDPPMGVDVVLHATATGKAWLATLPEEDALRVVCARGFATPPGFGARAVKNVDALRAHLADTRRQGYGLAVEEGEPGTLAIAMAFHAHAGAGAPVAGTVSIAGPLTRLTDARVQALVPLLRAAVAEIGELWPLHARYQDERPARSAREAA